MHPNGSRRSTPRPGGGRGGTRAAAQRRHRRTANASEPEMLHRSHHPAGEDVGGTTIATGWSMGRARSWPPCAATRPPSIARPSSRPSPRSPTSSSPSTTPPTVGIGAAGFTSSDRNTMVHGTNLDWTGARLADEVGGCTGTRVVENDANAAGWAAAGSILPTPVREGLDSGRARHQPVRVPTCGRASRRT